MGKYEDNLHRPMREKILYRRIHFTKVVNFNDPKPALMALRNCVLPEQGVLTRSRPTVILRKERILGTSLYDNYGTVEPQYN